MAKKLHKIKVKYQIQEVGMMRKIWWLLMIFMGVFILQGPAAHAGVIFSDDFNAENGGVGVLNYPEFAKWTVSNGSVDLIGSPGFYDFYPANGLYVDMDGSTGNAGKMTSKTVFGAGSYIFSFDLAGNSRNSNTDSVDVAFGDYVQTISLAGNVPFTTYTATVLVPLGGSAISFEDFGRDNIGMLLDNVKVASTPVPSALLLMGSGLLGLLGLRFRNR